MKKVFIKQFARRLTQALCMVLGLCIFAGCSTGPGVTDNTPDPDSSAGSPTEEPVTVPEDMSDPVPPPVRTQAIKCENITLNAYLIPMTSKELRLEMMQLCKDADIDLLSHVYPVFPYNSKLHTHEWYKEIIAEAAEYGLKLQAHDTSLHDATALSDEELRALADDYKSMPGFGGFFLIHEPHNPNPYAHVENVLREICPGTYINVNFMPLAGYPSRDVYIRQLCDYGGLLTHGGTLSMDTYDFYLDGSVDETSMFGNYEYLRTAGLRTRTNTAVYVQSLGMPDISRRRLTPSELRYNMMAALAYGFKELKFFTWGVPTYDRSQCTTAILDWDNKPTDLYYEVCRINKKIHAIGTHLASCDASYVYHGRVRTSGAYKAVPSNLFVQTGKTDVILSLMEERDGSGEYVFLVNKDMQEEQTVTLTFKDMDKVFLISDSTGELIETALDEGRFTVTLAAGDAELIRLPEGDFIRPDVKKKANLALNAPVYGTYSVGDGNYYLYNLTDGVIENAAGTRIIANRGQDEYLTVDLGEVQSINRVDLFPAGKDAASGVNNPVIFSILVSSDGENWTEVVKNTTKYDRSYVPVFRFESTEARFVCLCIREVKGLNCIIDIGEIRVYNDDGSISDRIKTSYKEIKDPENGNVALNKPIAGYSSTLDVPSWTSHNTFLNDGDYTTAWTSGLYRNYTPDATEWIVIDLLNYYDVSSVKLVPRHVNPADGGNSFPENYTIQVSKDGVNFETVVSVEGDNVPPKQDHRVLSFDTVTARFIRLEATRLTKHGSEGTGYGIAINEMEVFGTSHKG